VQCFASSDIEKVREEKKAIEKKTRLPVYIIFVEPYYKLHVGDFTKRAEARSAVSDLKGIGYDDAWIVQARVRPKK
jgi:hypothetical protein